VQDRNTPIARIVPIAHRTNQDAELHALAAQGKVRLAEDSMDESFKIADSPPDRAAGSKHKPMVEFLDTQKKLEPAYAPIKARFSFTDRQAAEAVAVGTALLIRHAKDFLDPNIAFGIAVYGYIEGAKTAPEPI